MQEQRKLHTRIILEIKSTSSTQKSTNKNGITTKRAANQPVSKTAETAAHQMIRGG